MKFLPFARPVIDALLFSLAIAVGITPQLLPAVVTTSLATGSRRLAQRKVLVKRLVCIEDLGNIEVLLTDKTGTLTEGHIAFQEALDLRVRNGEPCQALARIQWAKRGLGGQIPGFQPSIEEDLQIQCRQSRSRRR